MVTEKEILDMYIFLRKENQSIPDHVLEFMKHTCIKAIEAEEKSFSFEYRAQSADPKNKNLIGVWTDGISLISDNEEFCAFPLKKGKRYKVSVVEV